MCKLFVEVQELVIYTWKWKRKRMPWPKFLLFQMVHFMFAILTRTVKLLIQFRVTHWFYNTASSFINDLARKEMASAVWSWMSKATNAKKWREQKMSALHEVECFMLSFLNCWELETILKSNIGVVTTKLLDNSFSWTNLCHLSKHRYGDEI